MTLSPDIDEGVASCSNTESAIEVGNGLDLRIREVDASVVEVLFKSLGVGALGNDSDAALCRPTQENLSGGGLVLVRNLGDGVESEQRRERLDRGVVELNPTSC